MARRPPTPAAEVLDRAGVAYTLHRYTPPGRPAGGGAPAGEAAAAALGVDPGRVFKTLVALVAGHQAPAVVAVVPVAARLDLRALAAAVGGKRAEMAEPAWAERVTGYVVGGIFPVGRRRALPTLLDASARELPTMFVSGGRRGLEIEIAPVDLLRVSEARWARLTPPAA